MGSGCGTCGLWQVLVEFLAEVGMAEKSAKRRNCQLCVPQGCTVPSGCPPAPPGVPEGGRERGPLPEPPPCRCRVWGRLPPSSPVPTGTPCGCQHPLPHSSPFPGRAALLIGPSLPLWLVAQSFSPALNDMFAAAFSVPGGLSSPRAGAVLSPNAAQGFAGGFWWEAGLGECLGSVTCPCRGRGGQDAVTRYSALLAALMARLSFFSSSLWVT